MHPIIQYLKYKSTIYWNTITEIAISIHFRLFLQSFTKASSVESRQHAAAFFSLWISSNGISGSSLTASSTSRLGRVEELQLIEKTKEGVSYRGTPNHPKLDLIYIYIVLKPLILRYLHFGKPQIAFFFWRTKHVTNHYRMGQNDG